MPFGGASPDTGAVSRRPLERVLETAQPDRTSGADEHGQFGFVVLANTGKEDVDVKTLAGGAFPVDQHEIDHGFQPHFPAASREL